MSGCLAKRKDGPYATSSPWLKIKNLRYSQAEGPQRAVPQGQSGGFPQIDSAAPQSFSTLR
jgi:hypothetical protein